jgi:hypothetical protein
MAVGKHLAKNRKWRRPRRRDLSDHGVEIKTQIGIVFARELLHAVVIGKAGHVKIAKAAIARGKQRALEQRRAHTMALPRPLNGECSLRLATGWRAYDAQLGGPAQYIIDEEAVDDRIETECELRRNSFATAPAKRLRRLLVSRRSRWSR